MPKSPKRVTAEQTAVVADLVTGALAVVSPPLAYLAALQGASVVVFLLGFALSVVIAGVCVLLKYRAQHAANEQDSIDADLNLALSFLGSILNGVGNGGREPKYRVCVFDVRGSAGNERLVRRTAFFGDCGKHESGLGRSECQELHPSIGVVGDAFRCHKAIRKAIPSKSTDLQKHLVLEHGFTSELAAGVREDRRAWLAVPLGKPSVKIYAVLAVDSASSASFAKKSRVYDLSCAAGLFITEYVLQ